MGTPAERSDEQRAETRAMAKKIVEAVTGDAMILGVVHDYGDTHDIFAAEQMAIDGTKFGDLDACESIEMALLTLSQEVVALEQERNGAGFLLRAAARMDANELRAFRAWMVKRRDKLVEKAISVARSWRAQDGIAGRELDELAELVIAIEGSAPE